MSSRESLQTGSIRLWLHRHSIYQVANAVGGPAIAFFQPALVHDT